MPQRAARLPLFASFQRQATKALTALQKEITQRERELATLKTEATRLQSALQGPARGNGPAAATTSPRVLPSKQHRLDWSMIFKELPAQFTTKDVAQKTGKPIAQVYTHLSGWMKDKKVRKVKDGYQKVSGAA